MKDVAVELHGDESSNKFVAARYSDLKDCVDYEKIALGYFDDTVRPYERAEGFQIQI